MNINFDSDKDARFETFDYLNKQLEAYYASTSSLPVSPKLNQEEIKNYVHHSFVNPLVYKDAINHVIDGLKKFTVHTPHPNYFGLFNPRANFAGILADTITATFNP